jgi:hypothetical protein
MSSVVVVQKVLTYWTKASRGGAGATKRNAVPEAATLPLSSAKMAGKTGLLHEVAYRESDDFARKDRPLQLDPPLSKLVVGCVTINLDRDTVSASFRYSWGCCGSPERGWTRKTLQIAEGEWGQMIYNGRFVDSDGYWWYEKKAVNIGLFPELLEDVFIRNAPTYRFSAMAHLI